MPSTVEKQNSIELLVSVLSTSRWVDDILIFFSRGMYRGYGEFTTVYSFFGN